MTDDKDKDNNDVDQNDNDSKPDPDVEAPDIQYVRESYDPEKNGEKRDK